MIGDFSIELPGKLGRFTYEDEPHEYKVANIHKPGANEILTNVGRRQKCGDNIERWRSISGSELIDWTTNASKFGHAFHDICAFRCRGEEEDHDPALDPWVRQFEKFRSENPIMDPRDPSWAGKRVVIDWKTGAHAAHYRNQLAAYLELVDDWCDLWKVQGPTKFVEQCMYSPTLDFCGTPDIVIVGEKMGGRAWKDEYWLVYVEEQRYTCEKFKNGQNPADRNLFMSALNIFKG